MKERVRVKIGITSNILFFSVILRNNNFQEKSKVL